MTIDKNYNPLNPMVGQVKQFLDQKNIPREQVVPFLMSLGYPGLAGAVAGRMRLDQASEGIKALQQGQNAAPPTVVQENAQNAQQMQQMGQAMAQPPQQPGPINMAGGGIVAFSNGSTVSGQGLGGATWGELEDMFSRSGPEERARILDRLRRENPRIAEYLERGIKALGSGDFGTGTVSKTLKKLPYVSAGEGMLGIAGTTAEDLQRSSRLAQLGMNVDPNSYLKTFGAGLAGLAEEALPTSFFYETPVDRAQKASDVRLKSISNRTGIQSNLSDADKQQANAYAEIVRQFGSDSQEARDFEAQYRQGMGRATPEGEDELARLLAQSAASSQAAPAGGAAAGPRLPGVPVTAAETNASRELRGRLAKLPGAEDFVDPNKRQALIDREMAVKMEQYTKMGLFKPYDEAKEKVSGRLKELEGIKDKNFYKAMALMGFTMAGTKGSFFEALAAGGAAGISAYETFEERRQATLDKLHDRMMNIDMSIAGLKERAGAAASDRIDSLEKQRSGIENQITALDAAREQLAQTQSFQLAMSDREIAAQAARDEARFGGLPKDIERDIAKVREILKNPALSSQGKQAAEAKLRELYDELSRATQAGSGSYQSALVRAASNQIPGLTPQSEEGGGWGELTVR